MDRQESRLAREEIKNGPRKTYTGNCAYIYIRPYISNGTRNSLLDRGLLDEEAEPALAR